MYGLLDLAVSGELLLVHAADKQPPHVLCEQGSLVLYLPLGITSGTFSRAKLLCQDGLYGSMH
jgi:hypothetical protein